MDSVPDQTPAPKKMHGALKFCLMALTGCLIAGIFTPCFGGAALSATKGWTLKEQYAVAINFFLVTSMVFMVLSGIFMVLKRWGVAGFMMGVSVLMAIAIFVAEFMKMYDVPH